MTTKLVVIGASYLQLPLVSRAREMGIETHVFAWEKGAVARDACDRFYPISIVEKDIILEEARKINPDGIISIASDLAMVTVNYLANQLGLVGNSSEVTGRTTNKYLMRKKLSGSRLPCPRFALAGEQINLGDTGLGFPVIVKPTDRSGSRGVTKVLDTAELSQALERAVGESFEGKAVVEEFVEGYEISVEMISWQGEHHFLAMTDKVTSGPPHFVESEHHQPSCLPAQVQEEVKRTVKDALTCLGVRYGASHSELMITPNGHLYIIEIGARMGGDLIGSHLVELSTGYDFVKGVVEVCLGSFSPVKKSKADFSGVYYIILPPGRVTRIIDHTTDYPEIVNKQIFVNEGDVVGEAKESAGRAGYYIYAGPKKFIPDVCPVSILTEQ